MSKLLIFMTPDRKNRAAIQQRRSSLIAGIAAARQRLEDTGDRPRQRQGGGGDAAADQCVE
jgi:hypothetical protein